MKFVAKVVFALMLVGAIAAPAQISSFKHVVVIVQENRTPDNLFQGLCKPPFGPRNNCRTNPAEPSKYDILTANWVDKHSLNGTTQPTRVSLGTNYDLSHTHGAFLSMYDNGRMDGAGDIPCIRKCPPKPQFKFVDNSSGILNPYLVLATQYGWANYMFQTNQGPSFPAHQFLFGGTSAPSAAADAAATFAAENMTGSHIAGCIAPAGTTVSVVDPDNGNEEEPGPYPCFEHQTMADLLARQPSPLSWKYYAPEAGSIWTAPNAIQHICQSSGPGGQCTGASWKQNVDLTPADVLTDIRTCNLPNVSWVIPIGQNSDHAGTPNGIGGPSWVAAIVNAIGTNHRCRDGELYWNNTAIFITWDDWGGWYDHEAPTILPGIQGDYQYGFRVPLIVVSAYTPAGYVNNIRHDFGSILRFIEHNFNLGSLGFADARSPTYLTAFFQLNQLPRIFQKVGAPLDASFFLNDERPPEPPDTD
ncbi:MAG TPA: alkaline phosphatase family protein [Terriglobales bacterium]|nr:alkaline phosphatase family protein [Terriglobales bacterium]